MTDTTDPVTVDPAIIDLLTELVRMDTTSRRSNLELIAFIEGWFDAHGIATTRIPNADGTKASLIAQIGPDTEGGVALSAHTDCVPVDGQPWSCDPFTLTPTDDKLFGRGVADMKGFLAAALAAVPHMIAAPLTRPIQFVLSYDEELGALGAPDAVAGLLAHHPPPAAVFVGEPTGMEIITAHKGVRAFRVTVEGVDGHSSQPDRAANAIAALTQVAGYLLDLTQRLRAGPFDPRFDPPYTTVNLATLSGGQALNIVPRHAELTFEFRSVPGEDDAAIVDDLRRFIDTHVRPELRSTVGVGEVTIEPLAHAVALTDEPDGFAETLARRLADYQGPSRTVPFGTDGGHFQAAGLSTCVIGPGRIEQAHQPDEWIELEQLAACERFLRRLIVELSA